MPLSTTERDQIIKLMVGMFNAAPGSVYFAQAAGVFEANGHNLAALATTLAATPVFRQMHPSTETSQGFTTSFLSPFGLQNNATARQFVVSRFDAGMDKGVIISEAIAALDPVDWFVGGDIGTAAAILDNRGSAAAYYATAFWLPQADIAVLQEFLASVDETVGSLINAIGRVNPAIDFAPFAFQPGRDQLLGSSVADRFWATVRVGRDGSRQNSLETFDGLIGAGGTDTLVATLYGGVTSAPTLISVEQLLFRSESAANTLDLANATDVEAIRVWGSTAAAAVSHVGSVQNLAVTYQNQSVTFAGSTASTINLTLNTIGSSRARTDQQAITIVNPQATELHATLNDANVRLAGLTGLRFAEFVSTGSSHISLESSTSLEAVALNGAGSVTVDLSSMGAQGPTISVAGAATASNEIIGSPRTDTIAGGTRADVLCGGRGADVLTGGGGNNVFAFSADDSDTATPDVITDFHFGDLLRFDTMPTGQTRSIRVGVFESAPQAQAAIQQEATARPGAFLAALDGSTGKLFVDVDGDSHLDLAIILVGTRTIGSDSFGVG